MDERCNRGTAAHWNSQYAVHTGQTRPPSDEWVNAATRSGYWIITPTERPGLAWPCT